MRFGLGVGVVHADRLVLGSVVDGASLARAGPLDGALEEVSALDCCGLAVGHSASARSSVTTTIKNEPGCDRMGLPSTDVLVTSGFAKGEMRGERDLGWH